MLYIMANVIPVFVVLVVAVRLLYAMDTCSPCNEGKVNSRPRCNHYVSLESITNYLNVIIQEFDNLYFKLTERMNLVKVDVSDRCSILSTNPLIQSDYPLKSKIWFIHEIYANLTFVHDVLDSIESANYAQNAMCLLYQANMKLQCKRIQKNRSWANFDDSGACKQTSGLVYSNGPCSQDKEIEDLLKAKTARHVLINTFTFWNDCVTERKHRLMLKSKCRKQF